MPKSTKQPPEVLPGYNQLLRNIKKRIDNAQTRAALSVNKELIQLYWEIGKQILIQQHNYGWGKSIVERLAHDLRREFPDTSGFSARNLWEMRRFYEFYEKHPILQQLVAEIPWGHNLLILNKLRDMKSINWYLRQTIANGWSRSILAHQIDTDLYGRQVSTTKISNFTATLPPAQSELVQQTLKDPYVFDFLTLERPAKERDLERALIQKLRDFLLELGAGFAFMGSQYHLEVAEEDFYIDLLFYHHRLRCLVAIDIKIDDFKPEYAGKINFYLSALDDLVKHTEDRPSVGIILCKGKKKTLGEYALRDMSKPIGISAYKLTDSLPKSLQGSLPSIADLQAQLEDID